MRHLAVIGYSGHAYVVCDIFRSQSRNVTSYADLERKERNPYQLSYLGPETDPKTLELLHNIDYFVAIGDNRLRQKVTQRLLQTLPQLVTALHASAVISSTVQIGAGTMVGPLALINAQAQIGQGVICNSGCIIEHECHIGDFAHIGPGVALAGSVEVGPLTLIGIGAAVKPGVKIGAGVTIGAGAVILKDVPDGAVVVGNPQRLIRS